MKIFNNKADLALASLLPDQFVETYGSVSPGDGNNAKYYVKTAAQAASDGDVIDGVINFAIANTNVVIQEIVSGGGSDGRYNVYENSDEEIDIDSSNHNDYITLTASAGTIELFVLAASAPYGDSIVLKKGVGSVDLEIDADSGVTINFPPGVSSPFTTDGQQIALVSLSATEWDLMV